MKLLAILLLAGSGLLACQQKDSIAPATGVGQPFEVAYQQTATLPVSSAGTILATLTQVVDSRCPANAYCIWAGNAEVAVAITDGGSAVQTVRLSLTPRLVPDSVTVTLHQQSYWLRLLDVKPYPGTSDQTKTATLRLRPQ